MKLNFLKTSKFCMICVAALVFLILLNVLFGTSSPVPYYPESIFAKQFPYIREGLTTSAGGGTETNDPETTETETEEKDKKKEPYNEEKEEDEKKEGFEGLTSGPFGNEQYIGYLANVSSGVDCASTSNGYSNSKGYLCLSPDEIRYLQSRGGNATSKGDF